MLNQCSPLFGAHPYYKLGRIKLSITSKLRATFTRSILLPLSPALAQFSGADLFQMITGQEA